MSNIIPDKYQIASLVEEMKAKHIPDMSENTLLMSTLGAVGEMFTNQINMDLMAMSEISNESMPIRAKFDRNILTHAIQANVTNLYAEPAYMDVSLYISEKIIDANITNNSNTLVIDKLTPFYIEDFEFHLDYNLIITRSKPYNFNTEGYIYIAQYDMGEKNELSNITTPYLSPPTKINYNGEPTIIVRCRIRQIEYSEQPHKIMSDDTIENKTFEFSFESQLASFDILAISPDNVQTVLTPIFEGVPITDKRKKYVYYTHIDESTIRIKFISSNYNPSLNTNIIVRLKTTKGSQGNFPYSKSFIVAAQSTVYKYNNLSMIVTPYTESDYGSDMKTIDDLKREIPMRILARESLTSNKDLENYFNILNDENNTITFSDFLHNQNALKFYAFLLMKNTNNNIIPSNTLPIKIYNSYARNNSDVIKPGTVFHYNSSLEYAEVGNIDPSTIDSEDLYKEFYYTTPFLIKITRNPILHLSFYLNIIDISYITDFTFINKNAFLQFICTSINIKRKYLTDRNKYFLTAKISQNIDTDYGLIVKRRDGSLEDLGNLKCFYIFYDQYDNPVKYIPSKIVDFDQKTMEYTLESVLETNDVFDESGKFLNITNLNDFKAETTSDTYLPRQTKVELLVLYKMDGVNEDAYEAKNYIPNLDGYVLCNKYTIDPGIELFLNFSEIVNSVIKAYRENGEEMKFNLLSVPLIKYTYMQDEDNVTNIIDNLVTRKLYIDESLTVIQDPLGIDFKLYNTYGPSKTFKVGHDKIDLDRINISLKLRMKLNSMAQDNLKEIILMDIKNYIENINNISDFHYSNLDQYLRNKYQNIVWIEFVGINDYAANNQYIRKDPTINDCVPEFININITDGVPDIEISIV